MNQVANELRVIADQSGMHPKARDYFLKVWDGAPISEKESVLDFLRAYPRQIHILCILSKMKEIAAKNERVDLWENILKAEESLLNLFTERCGDKQLS